MGIIKCALLEGPWHVVKGVNVHVDRGGRENENKRATSMS